jgi:isopentenyldiphosphate isomerase
VKALVASIRASDYQLDRATYGQARRLFERCTADALVMAAVKRAAPEYGRREYLLNVDGAGKVVRTAPEILADFSTASTPAFGVWFQEAILPRQGEPVLLVARWLCHLTGLRHRTIHLFLDHPTLADHTLVQVRSVDKDEAPGCFDLPVAGHVDGVASVEETLDKELGEEVGLTPDLLSGLRRLGAHEQIRLPDPPAFRNVEHHTVYRARLTVEGWLRASAADHEVAAIAAFNLPDLVSMMRRFPDRVASGLRGSFSLYDSDRLG